MWGKFENRITFLSPPVYVCVCGTELRRFVDKLWVGRDDDEKPWGDFFRGFPEPTKLIASQQILDTVNLSCEPKLFGVFVCRSAIG